MPVIACKLPAGLTICHKGQRITLVGANIGEDLENVSRNGRPNDNKARESGFGLTTLSDSDALLFADWSNAVTYVDGKKDAGKLADPFVALHNGAILGPFKSIDEARRECASVAGAVLTGMEGLDPEKEGIEEETDENGKPKSKRK